jgi:hypothetical protein
MNTKDESKRTILEKGKSLWPVLAVMVAIVMFAIWSDVPATSQSEAEAMADVVVYKTPICDCCDKWVEHLRDNGFEVSVLSVRNTEEVRKRVGVPGGLASCHTAVVSDYWIEGHVPADLVQQLMAEKPANIRGMSAPRMSPGSPGMEGPNVTEYKVLAYDAQGNTSVYATRQGKTTAQ